MRKKRNKKARVKKAFFKVGDIVLVNSPMTHQHGQKGMVEAVSEFDGSCAVRFEGSARGYYNQSEIRLLKAAPDNGLESNDLTDGPQGVSVEQLEKSQPTSSQVHVPAMGEDDKIGKKIGKKKAHNERMLVELKSTLTKVTRLLNEFFSEEEQEEVGKSDDGRRIAKVAVIHDGKLLMGKRRDNKKWTIPGGHVEPQETMREGAMRELWEETGIEIIPQQLMPLTDLVELMDRAKKPLAVQAYIVRLDDRPSTSMMKDPDGEVERWRWVDITDGLDEEIKNNLHVPGERCTVLQALNLVEVKKSAINVDGDEEMQPGIDNLEAGLLKSAFGDDKEEDENWEPNDSNKDSLWDMQDLIEGIDWELENTTEDVDMAREVAMSNLESDPNHYRSLRAEEDSTDDQLAKDTSEGEQEQFANEGYKIDIGSGTEREPGHIGLDIFPYDHGTMVHDVHLGLPFPDESVSNVRMVNSLDSMDDLSHDPKPLLSEIHRVMMPGGQFTYEGPNEIYNEGDWAEDYPGLVLTNHQDEDDSNPIAKDRSDAGKLTRHVFTRVAVPDPATANDAEPRTGISQYDELPSDDLLAMDALGYYWSDATTSGRGNRLHGYASQGALVDKDDDENPEGPAPRYYHMDDVKGNEPPATTAEQDVKDALAPKQVNPQAPKKPVSKVEKKLAKGFVVPILKAIPQKQIVYGVILAPQEIDAQDDFMEPEEIEKAAHRYLTKSRVIGSGHEKPIDAEPVESFIAPQDLEMTGQYGPQVVKKGSWILGVKVHDPEEWKKIVNGEYTGFSVGGLGAREQT